MEVNVGRAWRCEYELGSIFYPAYEVDGIRIFIPNSQGDLARRFLSDHWTADASLETLCDDFIAQQFSGRKAMTRLRSIVNVENALPQMRKALAGVLKQFG